MYISVDKPTRSIRTARDAEGPLLLLGGEGHKPGTDPKTESRYRSLEDFGRRHWQTEHFPFRWSTQDYMPLDGVPYVGRLTRRSEHIYVATGFKKWGMTNGTAAAIILTDLILGRQNPWAKLYDAKRIKPLASAPNFIKENAAVARHFFGDRLRRGEQTPLSSLGRGEGKLVRIARTKGRRIPRRPRPTTHALPRLHASRLPRLLESRRTLLGLPLPRLTLHRRRHPHPRAPQHRTSTTSRRTS